MQLGSLLDGARHRPAVVHPVKFRVATSNQKMEHTHVEAEAVLVHVDEEERADALVDSLQALHKAYPDKEVPSQVRESWDAYYFLAVALRDKSDVAKPFAEGGAAQLRGAMVYSVAEEIMNEYRDFLKREYHPAPAVEDMAKMKEAASGK